LLDLIVANFAIEALKHQLKQSWNTDAQRIAAVSGLWKEYDWHPIRSWLYDYIVDPLKSDDKMPTSIRRLRLRLKRWMDIYDATEQWSERLELRRKFFLYGVKDLTSETKTGS
jgi:hypothetical protein